MAIQTVFVGTTPGDETGDPARTAFIKINDNFTQPENAASRLVGTAAGNVMEVGAFGLGSDGATARARPADIRGVTNSGMYQLAANSGADYPIIGVASTLLQLNWENNTQLKTQIVHGLDNRVFVGARGAAEWLPYQELLTTGNTTVDPNGFIKAASPIVSLYRDRAQSNGSAELEEMQFERISTGHYRLTGVPELSRDGWYIETPKDRNGNVYFTIDYDESIEGELTIRTYEPDYSTGRATNGNPVDIIDGRFVSLRFIEIPELYPAPEITPSEEA